MFFCGSEDTAILFTPNLLHQHATCFVDFFASFLLRAPATPHNLVVSEASLGQEIDVNEKAQSGTSTVTRTHDRVQRHSQWLRLESVSIRVRI